MNLDERIINEFRKNPLFSYRKIASILGISPQTISRRITKLRESGMRIDFISSYIPEALALTQYVVFYHVSNLIQFKKLIEAITCFNYIRGYNRLYGKEHLVLAFFDIPEKVSSYLFDFNEYLVEHGFCQRFTVHRALGYRHDSRTLLPYIFDEINVSTDELTEYFIGFLNSSRSLTSKTPQIKLSTLSPIHFYIINNLQKNARIKPSDLLKHSLFDRVKKEKFEHLTNSQYVEAGDTTVKNMEFFFEQVNDYLFSSNRTANSLMVDLNRKIHFVLDTCIYNPRLSFSRTHFMEYTTRMYIIHRNDKSKVVQLFNYVQQTPPPFQITLYLLEDIFLFRVTLPHYYDAYLNRTIWEIFPSCESYALDFFSWFGMYYPLYLSNFDYRKKDWRTDDYWLLDCPIKAMKMKGITKTLDV